jgi:hypothetical protein
MRQLQARKNLSVTNTLAYFARPSAAATANKFDTVDAELIFLRLRQSAKVKSPRKKQQHFLNFSAKRAKETKNS